VLAAASGATSLRNVKPVVYAGVATVATSSGGRSWLPFLAAGIVLSATGAGAGAVWWRKRRGEAGAGES